MPPLGRHACWNIRGRYSAERIVETMKDGRLDLICFSEIRLPLPQGEIEVEVIDSSDQTVHIFRTYHVGIATKHNITNYGTTPTGRILWADYQFAGQWTRTISVYAPPAVRTRRLLAETTYQELTDLVRGTDPRAFLIICGVFQCTRWI